jgi:SNF2 family DNA or RNA helicase
MIFSARETPNAFLLPAPSHSQQKKNLHDTNLDVFIDPFLFVNLRKHQIDGVKFLYSRMLDEGGAILADEMFFITFIIIFLSSVCSPADNVNILLRHFLYIRGLGKTLQCITLLWVMLSMWL